MKTEIVLAGMAAIMGADKVILAAVETLYEWVDKQRTEKVLGHRYTVVSPAKDWVSFDVRIDGPAGLSITPEELHRQNEAVRPVFVRFDGLAGKVWQDREKNLRFTCTASNITMIKKEAS